MRLTFQTNRFFVRLHWQKYAIDNMDTAHYFLKIHKKSRKLFSMIKCEITIFHLMYTCVSLSRSTTFISCSKQKLKLLF